MDDLKWFGLRLVWISIIATWSGMAIALAPIIATETQPVERVDPSRPLPGYITEQWEEREVP